MDSEKQPPKIIKLSKPSNSKNNDIEQALWNRQSPLSFDTAAMTIEDIGNILWATIGINRTDIGKKTAPSSFNTQDIEVYLFSTSGVYIYNPEKDELNLIAEGDHRSLVAYTQEFVHDSKQLLVFVSDLDKFKAGDIQAKLNWANIDSGLAAQNTLLYCSAKGYLARPRVNMEKEKIQELLKLEDNKVITLNIALSYNKK
ncbi:MAG: SagB/ThcOx family dehydrogenase [Saprospiraceae bacterium]